MSKSNEIRALSSKHDSIKHQSEEWTSFVERLTSVLSKMKRAQFLIIRAKSGHRFIQFACHGRKGMRVEVSSNNFLQGQDRLNRRQTSWLCANGWNSPTDDGTESALEKDRNGSPNYFVDLAATVAAGDIAHLAVDAMVHALKVSSPGSLEFEGFSTNDTAFDIDGLLTDEERIWIAMGADPECKPDTPESDAEIFAFMKERGEKPEDLPRPEDQEAYRAYLAKNA